MSEVILKEKKFRFKLLAGRYAYNAGTEQKPNLIRFGMNDIIETDLELDLMFNSPGATKFQRMEYEGPDTDEYLAKLQADIDRRKAALAKAKEEAKEEKPATGETLDEFSTMDLKALQAYANENKIALGKAKTRDEVLRVVREALAYA